MSTYRIETIKRPVQYWTNRGWSPHKQDATVYTESQRRTSIQLSGKGMPSFLPRDGCWVLISEPVESTYDERENTIKASLLLIDAELRANRAGQKDEMALLKRVRARVDQRTSEVSTNIGYENGRYVPSRMVRVGE